MGIGRSTAWVAWMLVATACGEELVASGESRARQELKHHHKHPTDAGTPSTDAGVPNCGLPVDAFRANWRAVTPGHKDTGLSLGKASPRLFDLLDVLDANGTPTGFPSLQGLTPTKKRMTMVAAIVAVTRKWPNGDSDDCDYGDDDDFHHGRQDKLSLNCVAIERLAGGGPKSILEIAKAVNTAAGTPVSASAIVAASQKRGDLVREIADANDHGENLNHVSTANTVVGNPVKQLLEGVIGAINAKHRVGPKKKKLWLAVANTQAGLDALMVLLGGGTPPAAPVISPVSSPTKSNPLAVSGTAAAGTTVKVTGGAAPVQTVVPTNGQFTVSVALTPNALNHLVAVAVNAFGDTSAPTAFDVIHDDAPPAVSFLIPADLAVLTRSPARVRLSVSDATAVASVRVNNLPAIEGNGAWEVEVPLPLGDSYLVATAADGLGNTATRAIAVTFVEAEGADFISASQGGTVTVAADSGSPIAGSSIVIPPGALPRDALVTLKLPAPAGIRSLDLAAAAGLVVELEPSGVSFAAPVQVAIRYNPALVRVLRESEAAVELFTFDPLAGWSAVSSSADVAQKVVRAALRHFSLYQAGTRCSDCLAAEVVAGDPTSTDRGDGLASAARMDPWWLSPMATGPMVLLDTTLTGTGARIRRLDDAQVGTVAGSLIGGSTADGTPVLGADLQNAYVVAQNTNDGTIYFATLAQPALVRKLKAGGVVETVAGGGALSFAQISPGTTYGAKTVDVRELRGLAVGPAGELYISSAEALLQLQGGGISLIAGGNPCAPCDPSTTSCAQCRPLVQVQDEIANHPNGVPVANARLLEQTQGLVSMSANGQLLYFANAISGVRVVNLSHQNVVLYPDAATSDCGARAIVVGPQRVKTIAGVKNGVGIGGDGASAVEATFNSPQALALDPDGNLFVSDMGNHRVRVIGGSSGCVSSFALTKLRQLSASPLVQGWEQTAPALVVADAPSPAGLALSRDGALYLAMTGWKAVVRVRNDDVDRDGLVTAVDLDDDGDGTPDLGDNCPQLAGSFVDTDGDGRGDACDACPFDATNDADHDGLCSTLGLRLPIPPANPRDNLLTRSVAQFPGHASLVVVSETEFRNGLESIPASSRSSSSLSALNIAYGAGERANDAWTGGVIAHAPAAPSAVTSDVWVVARDAEQAPTGQVLVRSYFVAAISMTVTTTWSARNVAFGQVPNPGASTGRCCGKPKTCAVEDLDRDVPPPCTPDACAGATIFEGVGGVPQTSAVHTYKEGLEQTAFCLPPIDDFCAQASFACNPNTGIDLTQTWQVEVPFGNDCHGGTFSRGASGRVVPKMCTYANGGGTFGDDGTIGGPSGGGGLPTFTSGVPPPECDGQCFGCAGGSTAGTGVPQLPRQCAVTRFLPGSGVCGTPNAGQLKVEQEAMRIAAGVSPGGSGESCRRSPRIDPTGKVPTYQCTVCTAAGCHETLKPSPINPIANASADCTAEDNGGCTQSAGTSPQSGSVSSGSGPAGGHRVSSSQNVDDKKLEQAPHDDKEPIVAKPSNQGLKDEGGETTPLQVVQNESPKTDGDPVLMGDGSFELSHVDLSFPGPVRALEFARSYNSRSKGRSELGSNWSHNWDIRLVPMNDANRPEWVDPFCAGSPLQTTCVMLHTGDTQRLFARDGTTGLFMPQAGVTSTLVELGGGGWMLRTADGHISTFDADGLLTRDEDRFGNAFRVEWEPNAWGRAFDAICPRQQTMVDASGRYVDSLGPNGLYSSASTECALLSGLTGRKRAMLFGPNAAASLTIAPATTPTGTLKDAIDLLVALQTSGGRRVGSASPWGARFMRVKRVRDGAGRSLDFTYYPDTERGTPVLAGLLRSVAGPAGARIEFDYSAPAGHPAHLNEVFLTEATRRDNSTTPGLLNTPVRTQRFTYAWTRNTISAATLATARINYATFLESFLNCGFHSLECGQPFQAGFTRVDTQPQTEEHVAGLASDVADNIIKVTNSGIVESETLYETDAFKPGFDKATRQRWGSTYTTPSSPDPANFDSQLPEATFAYIEASALPDGVSDETTAFLGAAIANRYPLEAVDLGAKTSAEEKGLLLPRQSAPKTLPPNPLAAIAEGELAKGTTGGARACDFKAMPALRTRIAGYSPSLDYFDTALPASPNADAPTSGVDTDVGLKRSRVSCDMLARAQTWDARHNDLQWTWAKPSFGDFVATRILGRRAHMNANANRICAWTKVKDRDGDQHLYGLNYHGRVLVDAVAVGSNWKFAETLYNADGNVISQRRTMPEGQSWTPAAGDTRYAYQELEDTRTGLTSALPSFWTRRANVTRIIQRPKGGLVSDEVEGAPGTFQLSRGRFATYEYEPFFNQVRRVVTGSIDAAGVQVPSLTTTVLFDYQEHPLDRIGPTLEHLQAFGFGFPADTSGSILFAELEAQLPVAFDLGDINGDGVKATAGLPVQVTNESGSQKELTLYRWSPSARPYFVQRPDGSVESLLYMEPTELAGAGSRLGSGHLAAVQHLPRKRWPANEGPARLPCPALEGPYQWLLPAGCSASTLAADLAAELKLPPEAAQQIVAQQADVDATTRYAYFATGQLRQVTRPDGAHVEYTRDLDGRVREEKLFDVGSVLHSRSVTTYDSLMRPTQVQRFDGLNQNLGASIQEWDEEGNLLYQCAESTAGGCARASHGALPATGTSTTFWYSPEAQLRQAMDAEGATTSYFRDARKWVTRTALAAPSEVTRGTLFTYDDDGQVLATLYGSELVGLLSETRSYDGLGRLSTLTDTEGRTFEVGHSRRELTARVDVRSSATGPVLWRSTWKFDALGRALEESTNGILTREVRRRAGGGVYASRSVGRRWMFSTVNAEGVPVFEEDEGGEVVSVQTSVPGARLATASSVSKAGSSVLTTSLVRRVDVLGNVVLETEEGEGTGGTQSRLKRDTDFLRNASGFVTLVMAPDGAQTENVYDFQGRPLVKRQLRTLGAPGVDVTQYTYDRRGALKQLTDPALQVTTQTYTGFGEPKTRRSPGTPDVLADWTYDVLGRVETETLGSSALRYEYETATGRLQNILGASGAVARSYSYDGLGRLEKAEHYNLGLAFTGTPVAAANRLVVSGLSYDALGRVASESTQVGARTTRVTGSTWGLAGGAWQRQVARPDGTSALEAFDTLGRLARMERPSGRTTRWDYQGGFETRVSSDTRAGGPFRRSTQHDGLGQALSWAHTGVDVDSAGQPLVPSEGDTICPLGWNASCAAPVQSVSVLRDKVGRVGSFSATVSRPNQPVANQWRGFTYDAMGRVTAAHEASALPTVSSPPTHTLTPAHVQSLSTSAGADVWGYAREASVGSVLSITRTTPGASPRFTSPARGPGHQLGEYTLDGSGTRTVGHDSAGRIAEEGVRRYGWDDFSALVSVRTSGVLTEALQYDGFGRLVARWNGAGLVEELAYDDAQMVAAFDAAQTTTWSASWAPGIDALLAVSDATGEYLALDDGKANVSGFFRADDSQLLGKAEYTPEGRVTWEDFRDRTTCAEAGVATCQPLLGLPFGFHSAYKSSSTGLIYFRNRWYSAEAGQWLSQDPLGYVDSFSAYAFNRFDPVNFVDPWGLNAGRQGAAIAADDDAGDPKYWADETLVVGESQETGGTGLASVRQVDRLTLRGSLELGWSVSNPPPASTAEPAKPDRLSRPAVRAERSRLKMREERLAVCVKAKNCNGLPGLADHHTRVGHFKMVDDNTFGIDRDLQELSQDVGGWDLGPALTGEDELNRDLDWIDRLERFFVGGGKMLDAATTAAGVVATAGAGGVAKGAAGQIHHIATDKAIKSGITADFERIFRKGGMSLQDPDNLVFLRGHAGRHSQAYHDEVRSRLLRATEGRSGEQYEQALRGQLRMLKKELEKNPSMVKGEGL